MSQDNSNERINITLSGEATAAVVTVLHGTVATPLPIKAHKPFQQSGNIDAPAIYAEHLSEHSQLRTPKHLALISRDEQTIHFFEDATDTDAAIVTGKLVKDPDYTKLGLNTAKRYSREELVSFLRMNRVLFQDKDAHTRLLAAVRTFEAQAQQTVKGANDNRGNKGNEFAQTVLAKDIPFDFTISVPIWKGQAQKSFVVEVCLDITDGSTRFWFESPDAAELEKASRDEIMDEERARFTVLRVTMIEQ